MYYGKVEICGINTSKLPVLKESEKIELLKKLSEEGKTPFSEKELDEYLSGYNGEMVSHGERYKTEYYPAYRVILEKLAEELQ